MPKNIITTQSKNLMWRIKKGEVYLRGGGIV